MKLLIILLIAFLVLVYVYTFIKIRKRRRNQINTVKEFREKYIRTGNNRTASASSKNNPQSTKQITKYNSNVDYLTRDEL